MPWWGQVTWDIARAGGFVAYGLLTLAVVTGLLMSLKWQHRVHWPRFLNNELHQHLLTLSLVFTVIHGLAAAFDPFTAFHWYELLVPGFSHYRPLWMSLGIVALYLGIAVGLSTWLRPRIGYRVWRALHYVTFVLFVLVTAHGLGTGSDTNTRWAVAVYAASFLVVLSLSLWRIVSAEKLSPIARSGAVMLALLLTVAGGIGTAAGPLRAGWNTIANNGQGSGTRLALATPAAPSSSSPIRSFQATLTCTQSTVPQTATLSLVLHCRLSQGATGNLLLELTGYQTEASLAITSSRIELTETGPERQLYKGSVQGMDRGNLVASVVTPYAKHATLTLNLFQNPGSSSIGGLMVLNPSGNV